MIDLSEYRLDRKDDEFIFYSGKRQTGAIAQSGSSSACSEYSCSIPLRLATAGCSKAGVRTKIEDAVIPIDLVKHDGRTMLVLANSEGDPLDRFIGTPLELRQFLRLAIGLSTALDRLHERGLVHKDIKPSNVLINSATEQVWLTGFGVASRLLREHQAPEPPEFLAGTLPYMAPEQTGRMNRSIDSRSDLYAFGIMLYEMLTGDLPFSASDPMEWVHCHVARQPVLPSERLSGVPGSVSAIIMKLVAKTAERSAPTSRLGRRLNTWT